jgi:hypothetical protein
VVLPTGRAVPQRSVLQDLSGVFEGCSTHGNTCAHWPACSWAHYHDLAHCPPFPIALESAVASASIFAPAPGQSTDLHFGQSCCTRLRGIQECPHIRQVKTGNFTVGSWGIFIRNIIPPFRQPLLEAGFLMDFSACDTMTLTGAILVIGSPFFQESSLGRGGFPLLSLCHISTRHPNSVPERNVLTSATQSHNIEITARTGEVPHTDPLSELWPDGGPSFSNGQYLPHSSSSAIT